MQIQISWLLRSQLIWIYTVCKGSVYPGSAGQGLTALKQLPPTMASFATCQGCLLKRACIVLNKHIITTVITTVIWSLTCLMDVPRTLGHTQCKHVRTLGHTQCKHVMWSVWSGNIHWTCYTVRLHCCGNNVFFFYAFQWHVEIFQWYRNWSFHCLK